MHTPETNPTNASARTLRRFAALALGAALAATTGLDAAASPTHTVAVGAVVITKNKCQFSNGGPTALSFGTIDPSSTANATATATIGFRCTGSSPIAIYNVTSDDGQYETGAGAPRMRHATSPTEHLKYTIDLPRSGSVPRNTNQVLTVTGTVLAADFQNALAGAYADSVVLSIAP